MFLDLIFGMQVNRLKPGLFNKTFLVPNDTCIIKIRSEKFWIHITLTKFLLGNLCIKQVTMVGYQMRIKLTKNGC